jgi:spermidine synthase
MYGLPGIIKPVSEFHENEPEQGIERIYRYYNTFSHHETTDKQEVDVLNSIGWGHMLFLDGVLQSTSKDEIIYHNALVHPLLDGLSDRSKILILGGGEGATAREVLRWTSVKSVTMVDYDKQLVDIMKKYDAVWAKGAFSSKRLTCRYGDAWEFMLSSGTYNGVIIDLTDPNLNKEKWTVLLESVMNSIMPLKGGFVMNAGPYIPWNKYQLRVIKDMVETICTDYPDYKYYIYTTIVPSFGGEWTFIAVLHKSKFMTDPEYLDIIPEWIRRGTRALPNSLIDNHAITIGITDPINK